MKFARRGGATPAVDKDQLVRLVLTEAQIAALKVGVSISDWMVAQRQAAQMAHDSGGPVLGLVAVLGPLVILDSRWATQT